MTGVTVTLPATWASFVDQVVMGGDPTAVARQLGYDEPRKVASALLRHPQVRKALATATEVRLESVAAMLALDTVEEILRDKDAPKAVRAKLAVAMLDRVRAKEVKDAPAASKNLVDMTPRELEQVVAQLQASGLRPGQMLDVTPGSHAEPEDKA